MAVIPNVALDLVALLAPVVLTGTADTFTYVPGTRQVMVLRNPTAGLVQPILQGSTASTSYTADGVAALNLSGGRLLYQIAVGQTVVIYLDKISQYLQGNCSVLSGTGLIAYTVSE